MAAYYDKIMLDGRYYDYPAIARYLAGAARHARRLLELGCGTGLVIDELLRQQPGYETVAGVDMTPGMLAAARDRLACWPQVFLHEQDVTRMRLPSGGFDVAWSYGGPWYFTPSSGDGGYVMVSHISRDEGNTAGLERVAAHTAPGGRLLLGVQAPHSAYTRPLPGGYTYAQSLAPRDGGFRKRYLLLGPDGGTLVDQVLDYRVYDLATALRMLAQAGLHPARTGGLFLEFTRR